MNWSWYRFHELGVDNLYDALALRCEVFILEQGAFLDTDGVDRHCWHLLGRSDNGSGTGTLHAYLRVVDAGVKYVEPSVGRVITSAATRGTGLGKTLMAEGLRFTDQTLPGHSIRISAQARLRRFYQGFGFADDKPEHIEDGIPHVEMLRLARAAG